MAIGVSGLQVELREVVLRDKPQEMLAVSPKGTVPVLCLSGGNLIEESLDIMMWALDQADPASWLCPETGSFEEMMDLIAACDSDFKHHLDRYKYASRYEGAIAVEHRTAAQSFLKKLESRLCVDTYLFGPRSSLADYAIMPFIRQFANTDLNWFENTSYSRVQGWLNQLLSSDIFTSVMNKYTQWNGEQEPTLFPA